jgi:phosphopantetheine adenylyltransferase
MTRVDLLVVSEETIEDGKFVNPIGMERGLPPAHHGIIPTVTLANGEKLSSTYMRKVAACGAG